MILLEAQLEELQLQTPGVLQDILEHRKDQVLVVGHQGILRAVLPGLLQADQQQVAVPDIQKPVELLQLQVEVLPDLVLHLEEVLQVLAIQPVREAPIHLLDHYRQVANHPTEGQHQVQNPQAQVLLARLDIEQEVVIPDHRNKV